MELGYASFIMQGNELLFEDSIEITRITLSNFMELY